MFSGNGLKAGDRKSLTANLLLQKVFRNFLAEKRGWRWSSSACQRDGKFRLKMSPKAKAWGCARLWEVEVWERAAGLSQGPKEMWNRGTFVLI